MRAIRINDEKPVFYSFIPDRNEAKNVIQAYIKRNGYLPHGNEKVSICKMKEVYGGSDEDYVKFIPVTETFTYEELIIIAYGLADRIKTRFEE